MAISQVSGLLPGCSNIGILHCCQELDSRQARQLGSLSRDIGIDKVIGKGTGTHSLWTWFLLTMKASYPLRNGLVCFLGKWTPTEEGIQCLRELEMVGLHPVRVAEGGM